MSNNRRYGSRLTLDAQNIRENDYFFFNNPVFVNGYAIAAAAGGAYSLKNAVILTLAGICLIVPVRIIGELIFSKMGFRLKPAFYVLLSSVISVPVMILMDNLFGGNATLLGLYLSLLFIDSIVIFRSFSPQREGYRLVFENTLFTALGYGLALVLTGTIRELLSNGTVWGVKVFEKVIWSQAAGIPGGLLVVAALSALWQLATKSAGGIKFVHEEEDNG